MCGCRSKGCAAPCPLMPSLCLLEPPAVLTPPPCTPAPLRTQNHPSLPREREPQRSLGEGVQCSHTQDPVLLHPGLCVTLAGWDAKLSPPLTLNPCRYQLPNSHLYSIYSHICTAFFISYKVRSSVICVCSALIWK